jgi:hypothetical protein
VQLLAARGLYEAARPRSRRDRMKLTVTDRPALPLTYKGHTIIISRVGKGWRTRIYPPESSSALPESPVMLEEYKRDAIVAEAKAIVDGRCTAYSR